MSVCFLLLFSSCFYAQYNFYNSNFKVVFHMLTVLLTKNHVLFFNQYALQFNFKFAFHISYSLLMKFMFHDEDILNLTQMHVLSVCVSFFFFLQ